MVLHHHLFNFLFLFLLFMMKMVACETALLTKLPSLCDKESISSQCFIIKACLHFAFNVKELTETKALIKRGNVESDRSQKDRRCVPKQPPHFSKKNPKNTAICKEQHKLLAQKSQRGSVRESAAGLLTTTVECALRCKCFSVKTAVPVTMLL